MRIEKSPRSQKAQQGYLLIFVALILLALVTISLNFFSGQISNSRMSGYSRDAEEAFMLAESAMNKVYGGFIYQADFNGDNTIDRDITIDLDNPLPLPNPYMYVVSDDGQITQTTPSILQRIADGEARAKNGDVNGASIAVTSATLMIDDLFSQNAAPLIFINDGNGLTQVDNNWQSQSSYPGKAAVWIEVIRDTFQSNKLYLFVQSAAQVGKSRSYVQRYIGEFTDTLGGQVNALTESSPRASTR